MSVKSEVKMMQIGRSDYTAANRLIHKGPCIVKSVHIACIGAAGDCKVYDGENANGELKAHLSALATTGYNWRPGDGTDFDHGIYVVVNASTTKVTVTYLTESKKDFV